MGRIVWIVSTSLDGFFEGPGADLSWHRVDEELHHHFNEMIGAMGSQIEGRVMYQLMAAYWPTADRDPAASPAIREYARIWRDVPKYVFSRTLQHADWNSTLVRDVVPADIRALKAQPGGDLSLGGADLSASFLRHDLIDELRIYIHPVIVGRGRYPFPPDVHLPLRLVETRRFGNGVVLLHYEVARA